MEKKMTKEVYEALKNCGFSGNLRRKGGRILVKVFGSVEKAHQACDMYVEKYCKRQTKRAAQKEYNTSVVDRYKWLKRCFGRETGAYCKNYMQGANGEWWLCSVSYGLNDYNKSYEPNITEKKAALINAYLNK